MPPSLACLAQAAALPIRSGQVCLVSSRGGKRWVLPKGRIEAGQTPGETALQEAWEEAGLVGILHPAPIGAYHYKKSGAWFHVTVFILQVTGITHEWPEQGRRLRQWLHVQQALARIEEPRLRKLVMCAALPTTMQAAAA